MSKKYTVKLGNHTYPSIKFGGDSVSVAQYETPEHGTEADDALAIAAILNVEDLSITKVAASNPDFDTDFDVVVNFTPITDATLLEKITAGHTRIRLQFCYHSPSNYQVKRINWTLPADSWPTRLHGETPKKVIRLRACDSHWRGKAWVDLTAEQLQAGSARLYNCYIGRAANCTGFADYEYGEDAIRCFVEMYCPALYRHNRDVFSYARDDDAHIISNIIRGA